PRRAFQRPERIARRLASEITRDRGVARGAPPAGQRTKVKCEKEPPMTTVAFSPERLARMHDVLAGYVERGVAPGLVALVSRGGETHVDVLGMLAVDGDAPMAR